MSQQWNEDSTVTLEDLDILFYCIVSPGLESQCNVRVAIGTAYNLVLLGDYSVSFNLSDELVK